MFFSNFCEKDKDEIELGDLDHHEFIQLLGVIYPCMQQITDANVEGVLKLADRFQMIPLQYSLEYYKESALRVKKLKQEVEYMQLSQEVKLLILENAVESMVEASLKLDNMSETFTNRSLDSSVFDLD
uniref:BTB domain-containing protein n=1 Tax=Ditylenchus dipsaci TaxID=166011 RepID=A0A915DY43_9BILA